MTESITPAASATGGPDLTPSKSLDPDPRVQTGWIGSGSAPLRQSGSNGNEIANRMIVFGIVAAVVGALLYFLDPDAYEIGSLGVFGIALSGTGEVVAILGLHALAVRAPRS